MSSQFPPQDRSEPPARNWSIRLASLSFALFCFEVGLFLFLLPWTRYWDDNWFAGLPWRTAWSSGFFRGAVSGLGLLNVALAIAEMWRRR